MNEPDPWEEAHQRPAARSERRRLSLQLLNCFFGTVCMGSTTVQSLGVVLVVVSVEAVLRRRWVFTSLEAVFSIEERIQDGAFLSSMLERSKLPEVHQTFWLQVAMDSVAGTDEMASVLKWTKKERNVNLHLRRR